MSLTGSLIELVARASVEISGEVIKARYGWKGCAFALVAGLAIFGGSWWHFTH